MLTLNVYYYIERKTNIYDDVRMLIIIIIIMVIMSIITENARHATT